MHVPVCVPAQVLPSLSLLSSFFTKKGSPKIKDLQAEVNTHVCVCICVLVCVAVCATIGLNLQNRFQCHVTPILHALFCVCFALPE